jgi:DNA repair exonuclease SbcCD nuclease subunit
MIVHCGDLHPMVLKNRIGETEAFNRSQKALNELYDAICKINPEVVAICGDLYDTHNPDKYELKLINDFLTLLLKIGTSVLVIPGNHDSDNEKGRTAIDYLEAWERTNSNLIVALRNIRVVTIGNVEYIMYPWGRKPKISDKMFMTKSKYRVGLMHGSIEGSKISEDGRTIKSHLSQVTIKNMLNNLRLNYLLMGDIHEQQLLFKKTLYCGSIYQTKFGESVKKGFNLIDLAKGYEFVELKKAEKLIVVDSLKKVTTDDYYCINVKSKEGTIKLLNSNLPKNVIKVNYPIKKLELNNKESNKKIQWQVSLMPIMLRILQKQGVKDIKPVIKYVFKHLKSKNDLLLS